MKHLKNFEIIGVVILILVILASGGIYIAVSRMKNEQSTSVGSQSTAYIPKPLPPDDNKESLQLKNLEFISTTPIPQQSFDCNYGELTSSEPNILYAMDPPPGTDVDSEGSIKIWYNDEHALTLGQGNISQYNSSNHVVKPSVGDLSAKDQNGLPIYPALFLSDVTADANNRSGDAQNGGTAYTPDEIWGTWLEAGGPDPSIANGTVLPAGADPFPASSNIKFSDGFSRPREVRYGAEIIWNVQSLGLTPGHSYRAQFIIHDGDRLGDIGMGCATIKM